MPRAADISAATYWAARRLWCRAEAVGRCTGAVLDGLWLGLLSRAALHRVDERYYDLHTEYASAEHNLAGLFDWEERAIGLHFSTARRILVLGAGGGREVLALARRGLDVDGYECHPGLRHAGSCLLVNHGLGEIRPMSRDLCPPLDREYDGVVLGWSTYMLIQGRAHRVALLRHLRGRVSADTPLLLSFFTRVDPGRCERIAHGTAVCIRTLLRREPPELGDALAPNFVHRFTRDELLSELEQGGWRLLRFEPEPYPHAVAAAASTV